MAKGGRVQSESRVRRFSPFIGDGGEHVVELSIPVIAAAAVDASGQRSMSVEGTAATYTLAPGMLLFARGASYGCSFSPEESGWHVLRSGTVDEMFYWAAWHRMTSADVSRDSWTFTTSMSSGWDQGSHPDPTGLAFVNISFFADAYYNGLPSSSTVVAGPVIEESSDTSIVLPLPDSAWNYQMNVVLGTPNPPLAGLAEDSTGYHGGTYLETTLHAESSEGTVDQTLGNAGVSFYFDMDSPPASGAYYSSKLHEMDLNGLALPDDIPPDVVIEYRSTMWFGASGPLSTGRTPVSPKVSSELVSMTFGLVL